MPIKFKCPHCQTALEGVDELAGTKRSCPKCGKEINVPKMNSSNETEPKESAKKD